MLVVVVFGASFLTTFSLLTFEPDVEFSQGSFAVAFEALGKQKWKQVSINAVEPTTEVVEG